MKKKILDQQISLFESTCEEVSTENAIVWRLSIDGASRGNPGPATCGIVLYQDGTFYKREGFFLNTMTNNQAEYMGLVLGLLTVKPLMGKNDTLKIVSDSQLLVRQMQGVYKVKNADLLRMYLFAHTLLLGVQYSFEHVLREYNQEADKAANDAFETRKKVPANFVEMMKSHEIIF